MERRDDGARDRFEPEGSQFSTAETRIIRWVSLGLAVLAVLLFEWTSDPAAAAMVLGLKLGLQHCLTAAWLVARDPNRTRGLVGGLWYLSMALFRVAVFALGLAMLVAVGLIAAEALAVSRELEALLLKSMGRIGVLAPVGGVLGAALGWVAVACSRALGVRIWLGPEVESARASGTWPPSRAQAGAGENRGRYPLLGMLIVTMIIALFTPIWGFLVSAPTAGPGPMSTAGAILLLFVMIPIQLIVTVGGAVLTLTAGERIARRVLAQSVAECWPETDRFSSDKS